MQIVVHGHSMAPLIANGTHLELTPDAPVTTGSIVVLRAGAGLPFIKRVCGISGDLLIVEDGHIRINGRRCMTSAGRPYTLSPERAAVLALYAGVIPADTYLALGDDHAGTIDSSLVGLIHRDAIIGVATLPPQKD